MLRIFNDNGYIKTNSIFLIKIEGVNKSGDTLYGATRIFEDKESISGQLWKSQLDWLINRNIIDLTDTLC